MAGFDEIIDSLRNNLTGEINAQQLVDRLLFGDNNQYINEFQESFRRNFFDPTSAKFKTFYTDITKKLTEADRQVEKFDTKVFSDPFGISEYRKEVKERVEALKNKLDKNINLDLINDEDVQNVKSKKSDNLKTIRGSRISTLIPEPNIPKQKEETDLEQKQFGPKETLINFSNRDKDFLKNLSNELTENLYKKLSKNNNLTSTNIINNNETGLLGNMMAMTLSSLLNKVTSTLLGGIGAIITSGAGAFMVHEYWDSKIKPWMENTLGIKTDRNIGAIAGDVAKVQASTTLRGISRAGTARVTSWMENKGLETPAQIKVKNAKLAEDAAARGLNTKQTAFFAQADEAVKPAISSTKAIESGLADVAKTETPVMGLVKGLFSGEFFKRMFGPTAMRLMAKFGGWSLKALKVVPGIGAIVSGYLAYERIKKNDYLGATLDILSGVGDILSLTGIGAAIGLPLSIGAMVIEAITDWTGVTGGDYRTDTQKETGSFDVADMFNGLGKMLTKSKLISALIKGVAAWGKLWTAVTNGDYSSMKSILVDMSMFPVIAGVFQDLSTIMGLDAPPQEQTPTGSIPNSIPKPPANKNKKSHWYNPMSWGSEETPSNETQQPNSSLPKNIDVKSGLPLINNGLNQVNDGIFDQGTIAGLQGTDGKYVPINPKDGVITAPFGKIFEGLNSEIREMKRAFINAQKAYIDMAKDQARSINNIAPVTINGGGGEQPYTDHILRHRKYYHDLTRITP